MKLLKTLYLDMDGVLCDMEHTYQQEFGMTPLEARKTSKVTYDTNWHQFVAKRCFRRLPMHPGAQQLLNYVESLEGIVNIAILSSSSGLESHFLVQHDKLIWLEDNDIDYPALIVPGRFYKKNYANVNSFLVDDFPSNIHEFVAAGGHGIIHTNSTETIEAIERWVNFGKGDSGATSL